MSSPAGRQRGNSVQLRRESGLDDPADAAVLLVTDGGIPVESQIAHKRGAVEPQELVTVGNAPLVSSLNGAVSSRFGLHELSVLLKPREYLGAIVDLQNPMDFRVPRLVGPTRFEYYLNDILTRIAIDELGYRVLDRLVLLEEMGFLENLAAGSAGEDIVAEG